MEVFARRASADMLRIAEKTEVMRVLKKKFKVVLRKKERKGGKNELDRQQVWARNRAVCLISDPMCI
jgi:hypothetical protein